jgi:glycosyltransferase involved in cell wall biosynthesis
MVLGIDVSRLVGPRTGVGRHLEHLLESWSHAELPFDEVRLYAHAPVDALPIDRRFRFEVLSARRGGIGWQIGRLRPRANAADVFLGAYTLPPGVRTRCAVLNLGILEGRFAVGGVRAHLYSRHFAWSCRRADLVIAISNTTKQDLVRWYGADAARIRVEHPGLGTGFRSDSDSDSDQADPAVGAAVERALGRRGKYVLFVGKLSARRHIAELVQAFREVASDWPEHHLLLVGPNTGHVAKEDLTGERVVYVPFLELDELALLYRGACAFVLPTEREGFSHTVAEAMGVGCPVLLLRGAQVGVLEGLSAEDPVLRADDSQPGSLAAALRRLFGDPELRAQLREAGRCHAKSFPSWDEHAARVVAHLAEVAQGA